MTPMADTTDTPPPRALGLRAGAAPLITAVLSTERAVAVLVLGALVALIALRRGMRGVLGG